MTNKVLFITVLMITHGLYSQSFKEQFSNLVSKNDTTGQDQLLKKWEASNGKDPELYVAYFNYFVNKSKRELVRFDNHPKGESLEIKSNDTTQKEPVGYMYSELQFEPTLLNKGFEYIDKGIKQNPARLDMLFGKVYMLGKIEDYERFTNEIIKVVDYSNVIKNKWTWSDSKPLENPKQFMLDAMQGYIGQLYNTQDDKLLINMRRIAEEILKFYPDHVESLSNLSITYLIEKEYDKALPPLLKAEKLAPTDPIVLGNIAQAFKLKQDYVNAIKYYELVVKYAGENQKKFATSQIEELKKKK